MAFNLNYLLNRKDYNDSVDSALDSLVAGVFPWTSATGPINLVADNGYVANNSSLVIFTLPLTANFGSIIKIIGKGAGGWSIVQLANQAIHVGNMDTTLGIAGVISSTNTFDSIELLCTTNNTNWTMVSMIGNLTIV